MIDDRFVAGVALLALLTILPGADMALVAQATLTRGRGAALRTSLGICAGLPFHAAASALGLSVILATSAEAFTAMRFAGALYLAYLGVQSIRQTGRPIAAAQMPRAGSPFMRGLLSNLLNPKVAVFYLTFLPQFIGPGDDVLLRSEALAFVHAVMGLAWLALYAYALDRLARLFARPSFRAWLERASGVALLVAGARLALERR